MSLEAARNYILGANFVVVRDTETHELYEVYLQRIPGIDATDAVLAIVEQLHERLIGRVDADLTALTPMWRCWIQQIETPRWDAMRDPGIWTVGNFSMTDHSGALACDVVDAYRVHVLRRESRAVLEASGAPSDSTTKSCWKYLREP